jgi:hypothetical protein
MMQYCNSNPGNIVAYYYFSFNGSEKQTAYSLVSSLVVQVCCRMIDLPKDLTTLYDKCDSGGRKAAIQDLQALLKSLVTAKEVETTMGMGAATELKDIFIIIDALDESP